MDWIWKGKRGRAVLLSAILAGPACADDTPATTLGPGDSSSSSSSGTGPSTITITTVNPTEPITSGDTTTTGVDSTSGGSTTTGDTTDGTTTGGEVIPGQTINQLVSAGGRAAGDLYTVTYTLGQPSQLQSTHVSPNYSIQGGLIGANGSPP